MISKNKLEQLVIPWLENDRIKFCEAKVSRRSGNQLIQLFVDLEEEYISIGECARISRRLQDLIDMQDWSSSVNYRLVVSSPGLDWPLKELWQFRKNISHLIRHCNTERTLEGRLLSVTDDGIILLDMKDKKVEYTIEELNGAKVVAELNRESRLR
jgi:ribosome maturation factor RimP